MADVEFKLDDKRVLEFFSRVRKNVDEVTDRHRAYWGSISAIAYKDVIRHFETESGPDGKWKAWSPSYKAQMKRIGMANNQILQFSGRLRQLVMQATQREKISRGVLLFNPGKTARGFPYAYAHDNDESPRTRLPRRSFLWLSGGAQESIAKLTAAYFLRGT